MVSSANDLPLTELVRRACRIRIVLTDCDGVLTDAGVYYSAAGEELKRFSVRDGMGVARLRERGVSTAIVTRESSECVLRRAEKLSIRAFLGVRDKAAALAGILAESGVDASSAAYIGDDLNDVPAMLAIGKHGLVGAPADAMPEAIGAAHLRTASRGGHGAFRDFAEWILTLAAASPEAP